MQITSKPQNLDDLIPLFLLLWLFIELIASYNELIYHWKLQKYTKKKGTSFVVVSLRCRGNTLVFHVGVIQEQSLKQLFFIEF